MKCPSCGAAVEDGADLCLECGEPIQWPQHSVSRPLVPGESPAAKAARAENVIRPPADTFAKPTPVARITPKPTPPPLTRPAGAPIPTPRSSPTPPASAPPPPSPTIPAKPAAKRKWAEEEPEPVRCPGCGVKSHAPRCPNCGTRLKHDDD